MSIDIAALRSKLEAALGEQLQLGDLLGQGGFGANERVGLVFIQAKHTFADALLLTDSEIVRRSPRGTVRRSLEESDINLQPLPGSGSAGGLLIVRRKGSAPDTLYNELSAREGFRLMNEFTPWRRARKARDSTSR